MTMAKDQVRDYDNHLYSRCHNRHISIEGDVRRSRWTMGVDGENEPVTMRVEEEFESSRERR